MRRHEKKDNIAKANLMAEQTYLKGKGIITEQPVDELSTGLAHKAASLRGIDYDSSSDPLSSHKLAAQLNKFDRYVNPDIKNMVRTFGGDVFQSSTEGVVVGISADANTIPSSSSNAALILKIEPTKYEVTKGEIRSIDSDRLRRLGVMVKKIQADMNSQVDTNVK